MIHDKRALAKLNIGKPGRDAKLVTKPSSSSKTHNDPTKLPPSKPSDDSPTTMTERTNTMRPTTSTSTNTTSIEMCDQTEPIVNKATPPPEKAASFKPVPSTAGMTDLWVNKNFKPRDQVKHDTQGKTLVIATDAQPPSPPPKRAPLSEKAASTKPASSNVKTETNPRAHATTKIDATVAITDGHAATTVKTTSAPPTDAAPVAKVKSNTAASRRITPVRPAARAKDHTSNEKTVKPTTATTAKDVRAAQCARTTSDNTIVSASTDRTSLGALDRPPSPKVCKSPSTFPQKERKHPDGYTSSAFPPARMHMYDETIVIGKVALVEGDGSCLLSATKLGDKDVLRTMSIDWIQAHPSHPFMGTTIADYIAGDTHVNETVHAYLIRMRGSSEWASLAEAEALSQIFKRPIRIFIPIDPKRFNIKTILGADFEGVPIDIVYESHHFNALTDVQSADVEWPAIGNMAPEKPKDPVSKLHEQLLRLKQIEIPDATKMPKMPEAAKTYEVQPDVSQHMVPECKTKQHVEGNNWDEDPRKGRRCRRSRTSKSSRCTISRRLWFSNSLRVRHASREPTTTRRPRR